MNTLQIINLIAAIVVSLSLFIGGTVFIVRWCFNVSLKIDRLENSFNNLEKEVKEISNKLELIIINLIPSSIAKVRSKNNPLPKEDIKKRHYFLQKLENHTISKIEAKILRDLLKIEEKDAKEVSNWDLLSAIGVILMALNLTLSEKELNYP